MKFSAIRSDFHLVHSVNPVWFVDKIDRIDRIARREFHVVICLLPTSRDAPRWNFTIFQTASGAEVADLAQRNSDRS